MSGPSERVETAGVSRFDAYRPRDYFDSNEALPPGGVRPVVPGGLMASLELLAEMWRDADDD